MFLPALVPAPLAHGVILRPSVPVKLTSVTKYFRRALDFHRRGRTTKKWSNGIMPNVSSRLLMDAIVKEGTCIEREGNKDISHD